MTGETLRIFTKVSPIFCTLTKSELSGVGVCDVAVNVCFCLFLLVLCPMYVFLSSF